MVDEGEMTQEDIDGLIEENAQDLYENAPCGYISTLPNGTIAKVNTTFLRWVGYERGELLRQKRLQDLLTIGSRIYYDTHFAPLLQMQGFINEVQLDLQGKQKQQLPVLVSIVQVKTDQGKPLLNRLTLFNITDRKKYERELLLARKKAEDAAKAKAEFLSTVSHEIRTPLNAIIGISNLLADSSLDNKQQELVSILRFSSDNLLHLINDILDFSKIEAGKVTLQKVPVNLRELVFSTVYSLGVKAEEKGLRLDAQIDEQLPAFLLADKTKLTQVLTNLLGNAIKFTEAGTVSLCVQLLQQSAELAEVRIAVSDTGIGIPNTQLANIFEEFTQASYDINVRFGGTGLGLSISNKLLHLMESELQVESKEGQGSTFSFMLRLGIAEAPGEGRDASVPQCQSEANSLAGIELLLAEDNQVNVFVIRQFLEKWGVRFDVAQNGEQAVEMVQRKPYHLVLMDLQMPIVDGYEASRRIRSLPSKEFWELPIIALSASSRFDLQERLEDSQMTDFIGKPFDPAQLHALISHYAARRKALLDASESPLREEEGARLEAPAFSLSQFFRLTEGDPVARRELFTMTIRDLKAYMDAFLAALSSKDAKEFGFQAHKSKMILQMLEASDAQRAIQESRALLLRHDLSHEETDSAVRNLSDSMEALMRALQEAVPA